MKKKSIFEALSNFDALKREFEDLEYLVFRSGQSYVSSAVEYRLNIWRSKIDCLPKCVKLIKHKTINNLFIREISIRSHLILVKKIEDEIKV
jgi:hypothetical protein